MRVLTGLALIVVPLLPAQTGGSVEGRVVDSVAHRGIPGVAVELTPADANTARRGTITDAAGGFRIEGLPPGDYTASYKKDGFSSGVSNRSSGRVHIGADGNTVQLTGVLIQLASLSGRVVDSDGHPFPKMTVQLRTASEQSSMAMLITDTTDQAGRFRFSTVRPGQYLLNAQPIKSGLQGRISFAGASKKEEKKPEEEKKVFPAPPSVKGERWMWVNTFYPGVMERSQAGRIVIHPGWNLDGYDIRMQAAPVFHVRGIVLGEDAKPAPGVTVGISVADRWEHDSDGTKSKEDGTFDFESVHQGDWQLMAMSDRRHGEEPALEGFAEALVARHDLENVVIHLSAPFSLSGTVEPAESRDSIGKMAVALVTVESVTRPWSASGDAAKDGTFRIDAVYPGRYRITPYQVDSAFYVDSVRLGERDVTDQELEIGAGAPPIRVIYRAGAGRVNGTVENGDGATVVLLPKEEALLTYQYVRSVKCDSQGRYELDGLRPGDYYALAFPNADLNTLEDPEFVRPLMGAAVAVRVDNGRVASVALKVTAWPE